jgi:hypothetical protein
MSKVAQSVILSEINSLRNEVDRLERVVQDYFLWLDRAAEHRNEAEASIREACPADRHEYYNFLLSYHYCPYCGERLLS